MLPKMRYRLALDLGTTSLGWAMVRLDADKNPCAVIKAGVRIFSDGRNPKDGSSLAVTRREARAMRRRRDRLLKRKARMMRTLIEYGFFPAEASQRKALETLNPFVLSAKGLDQALTPAEFARALFHINQRRGFKSNRKTDKKDNDSGALKTAIGTLRQAIATFPLGLDGKPMEADKFNLLDWVERNLEETKNDKPRTVGELLHIRAESGKTVRARYHQDKTIKDGKPKTEKYYDLYIDRDMIEAEFDALWAKQSQINPAQFTEVARADLKDVLLHQRPLKPVKPGRCTFMPDEERAPLALPSTQRFRMYQEVNNLRILRDDLKEVPLTLKQRDDLIAALEEHSKRTFTQIKKLLGMGGTVQFNFEDPKRQEFKGNTTSAILSKAEHFGSAWFKFDEAKQDAIVMQLVKEENEAKLVHWLQDETGVDEKCAEAIANTGLPEGYGSLCSKALARILPELRRNVVTFDKAVIAAGFDHHSRLNQNTEIPGITFKIESIDQDTGEIKTFHIFNELPYYGEPLQRHVGFGTGNPNDTDEKRYGKIANPTVHIGLNQVRLLVNAFIKRYGHPSEVIVELARDLKQSKEQRDEDSKRQADNQKRNTRLRKEIAGVLKVSEERVKRADIEKMILWEKLSVDPADRHCPYSGVQISVSMLLSDEVEIEHILPFSQTLDDSLNNKTVAMRKANRVKGNRTPWEARQDFSAQGWSYADILARAEQMPKSKRYRFAEDGYQRWLKDDKGFLPRALNDTRHLSKVASEYLRLVCPNTRVIPGRMTAMLRAKFGLNDVLGLNGEKNRNDHRHHAVDACVIAVTDQGLLQRFAQASASAREQQLNRLVKNMPLPWESYREHVQRAIENIWVSHKPDHSHHDEMFDQTIYNADGFSKIAAKIRTVIPFNARQGSSSELRHRDKSGQPKPYKGLLSNSNYCIEIIQSGNSWEGEVIPTYKAYEFIQSFKRQHRECTEKQAVAALRSSTRSITGKQLVMRLSIDDTIRVEIDGVTETLQVLKINSSGSITFIRVNETNIPNRYSAKLAAQKLAVEGKAFDKDTLNDEFFQKAISANSLRELKARRVSISPIGELHDLGFKG
jgi:CRISPR-associated endonuclease Csn1